MVISTDAHQLSQIKGPYTRAYLEDFTVQELTLALKREQGRSIKLKGIFVVNGIVCRWLSVLVCKCDVYGVILGSVCKHYYYKV